MKKIMTILALMMMTVATVTLVSCSKDDDDDDDFLAGEWEGRVEVTVEGYTVSGRVLVECENGKGIRTVYFSSQSERVQEEFTYSVGSNTITITPRKADPIEYDYIYNEKKGKLTMTASYEDEDGDE